VPEPSESTQLQVATLLIDGQGRLTQRIQAGRTLRAAILVDLVAAGALRNETDSIEIVEVNDLLPLGRRMRHDMAANPDKSPIWWAHHEHISVKDAAEEMVDLGVWRRHEADLGLEHRYSWRDDAADIAQALRTAVGSNYETADRTRIAPNLALVGGLWGGPPSPPDADVTATLGRVNWLVPDLIDYLWNSAAQLKLVSFGGT
jgi:hypothetical protein